PVNDFSFQERYDIQGISTSNIIASFSVTYSFDSFGGCTIYTDILGKQTVALLDIMFVMAVALSGSYSMLVPKSLPLVHETVNYDFSSPVDMTSFTVSSRIPFTPARCEPTGI